MNIESSSFSEDFSRVYCDPEIFESFCTFHPISFRHVLPFQPGDRVVDDRSLINAEEAHLADADGATRRRIVDEYSRCGLLSQVEAANLKAAIDFYDADFFGMMGLVYANAGMFRCALRWDREWIRELETQCPDSSSDNESIHANVGYCLYSLGLFEEAISWTKSCVGPRLMADVVCRALISCELQSAGGVIRMIERSGPRTRYTISSSECIDIAQRIERLRVTMKSLAFNGDVHLDWIPHESSSPEIQSEGYPFKAEFDGGSLIRHKMNFIFASCSHADALVEEGYKLEAKQVLTEAAMVEPEAGIVRDRLAALT